MTGMDFLEITPSAITGAPLSVEKRRKGRTVNGISSAKGTQLFVVAVIALSPLPGGSNHPLAWLFWSTVFGLWFAYLAIRSDLIWVLKPVVNRRIFMLATIFLGFAGFQALPLPALTGGLFLEFPKISVVTAHVSISPHSTWLAATRGCGYLLFFALVIISVRDRTQTKQMGWIIFLIVAVHAVLALVSLNFLEGNTLAGGKTAFPGAATGTFINKNSFATFLGLGLVLGLSLVQSELSRKNSIDMVILTIGLTALAMIFATLLMTQSRLGVAATYCAAVIVLLVGKSSRKVNITLAVTTAGFAFVLVPNLAQVGFFDLTVLALTRFELYQQIFTMIAERPLLGFGLDSFAIAFEPYHRAPVTAEFVWDKSHSTYLALWVQAGLLFGSIPIAIGGLAAFRLWALAKTPERGRSLALAGFAALVLSALHSVADFSLEIQANMFLLIAIVALGLGGNQTVSGAE